MMKGKMFLVVSAEISCVDESVNKGMTKELQAVIEKMGLEYKTAKGFYKGASENSFVVSGDHALLTMLGRFALSEFDQECYLMVSSVGRSYLHYNNYVWKYVGNMVEVDEATTKTLENYTEADGTYYTTIS